MNEKVYDLIVIGGGACGLAACITALRRGKSVIVLEKEDKVGKKILMTGNGKCNLSNANMDISKYNSPFVKDIIKTDVVGFFSSLGLATKFSDGRVYPYSESALSVVNILRKNCESCIKTGQYVEKIFEKDGLYNCCGFLGKNVLLASGSKATRGTDSKSLFQDFGHNAKAIFPSLVPLRTDDKYVKNLSGLRAKCEITLFSKGKEVDKRKGEVLFKDNGISGIVAMELSTYMARHKGEYSVSIDFVSDHTQEEIADFCIKNGAESFLHKAIAQNVERQSKDRNIELNCAIKDFRLKNISLGDIKQAQVVSGGLDTKEFDENLQSKIKKGLYAGGEVLDVDGECGGFNLHFAFASGIQVGMKI